jgi:hypothetical protein
MAAQLITLAEAKAHLRLTTPEGDPTDADLVQKLAAAEAAVLSYVRTTLHWRTVSADWISPATVPLDVHHAILLQLGELDRFRGDDLEAERPARDASAELSPAITSLLRRWRDPVVA